MKVKYLIDLLLAENPEKEVLVQGYESGYDELDKVKSKTVKKINNVEWWDGEFEFSESEDAESVIVLERKNKR
jgi:hypothetical protein